MFGLLYTLFVGGARAVKGIQDTIENEEFKQKYRDDESGIYYDNKMRKHDQRTGRIVVYEKDLKTGDVWVKDALSCERLRNVTQNSVEQHYEEERRKYLNGTTARTYVQYGNDAHRKDKCRGKRYKDLKTGKLYVVREIEVPYNKIDRNKYWIGDKIRCLMDLQTYQYVRPTDRELAHHAGKSEKIEGLYKAIEYANKEKNIKVKKYEKTKDINPSDLFWYELYKYESSVQGSDMEELPNETNEFFVKNGRSLKEYVEL